MCKTNTWQCGHITSDGTNTGKSSYWEDANCSVFYAHKLWNNVLANLGDLRQAKQYFFSAILALFIFCIELYKVCLF